jgi:N-acetylglucosamine-6-phosphate deacetylase
VQVQLDRASDAEPTLIGSCITMHDAFVNAHLKLGVAIERAVDLCCCTPARVARLEHIGQLTGAPRSECCIEMRSAGVTAVGRRADLVMMSNELQVEQVLIGGQKV